MIVILKQQRPVTVEAVREGLSVDAVEKLAEQIQVTSAALQRYLKLSRQTYARRRRRGRLSVDESDRVVRYADLFRSAVELLGDTNAAAQWLRTPAPALNGETPMDRATTEFGARDVIRLINQRNLNDQCPNDCLHLSAIHGLAAHRPNAKEPG